MSDAILCVNAGSSTLKCAVFERDGAELAPGPSILVEGVGREAGGWSVHSPSGESMFTDRSVVADQDEALKVALDGLAQTGFERPAAIGHRVVHGGPRVVEHAVIDDRVMGQLRAALPFAPLHLPSEIAAIDALAARYPEALQVACLDTAFHRSMPEVVRRLPLPRWVYDEGVERYGFHGLSYEYVVATIGAAPLGKAVVAHLGSGASLAAVFDGRSRDTTMGFTPAGGVVMASRTGDLDPGTLVYLAREHNLGPAELDHLVNHESGLLGISGTSADMAALLRAEDNDGRAALAVASFCHHVQKAIASLTVSLGGLDTLVFTAGIGENAPEVRARIVDGIEHLGVELAPERNDRNDAVISRDVSRVAVRVVATDENAMIARHTARLSR